MASVTSADRGMKGDMTGFTLGGFAGVLIIYSAILISAGIVLVLPAYLRFDDRSLSAGRDLFLTAQYLLVILAAVVLVNLPGLDDRTRAAKAGTTATATPGR